MTVEHRSTDQRLAGHEWRQLPHCTTCGVRLRYVAGAWRHVRLVATSPGRRTGRAGTTPVLSHEPVYVRG